MRRAYYSSSSIDFLAANPNAIIGELTRAHARNLDQTQLNAWLERITILKRVLINRSGRIYFEYAIPRMGKRIDVVLIIGPVIIVFKVGAALDQFTNNCLKLEELSRIELPLCYRAIPYCHRFASSHAGRLQLDAAYGEYVALPTGRARAKPPFPKCSYRRSFNLSKYAMRLCSLCFIIRR
jgi:hypothetical protein